MHTMPGWALTISYALHLFGTVVWVGGLVALALIVTPAAQKVLDPLSRQSLLSRARERLDQLGWFSIALLAATGLFQLTASAHYQGFLVISGQWAMAILIKHLAFALMLAVSAYHTWFLAPELSRNAFRQAKGLPAPPMDPLLRRQRLLAYANLALATAILILTAIARASV